MPIEFPCRKCAATLEVPDGSEGEQAFCPECSTVQPVPESPTSQETANDSDEEKPKLHVPCPHCKAELICDPALEGTKGQCRKCRAIFIISSDPKPLNSDASKKETFVFNCPDCGHLFEGTKQMDGLPGKCPECSNTFEIVLRKADPPKRRRKKRKLSDSEAAVKASGGTQVKKATPQATGRAASGTSDTQPDKTTPIPVQPVSVQPTNPNKPIRVQPLPGQPLPVQPIAVQPIPVQPIAVQPLNPTMPANPSQPIPVQPIPVQSVPAQTAQPAKMRVACPNCRTVIAVAASFRGQKIQCTACRSLIQIPA